MIAVISYEYASKNPKTEWKYGAIIESDTLLECIITDTSIQIGSMIFDYQAV